MNQIRTRRYALGVMLCLVAGAPPAFAQFAVLQPDIRSIAQSSPTVAAAGLGELHGLVVDDRGQPVAGAVVSALGATTVFAVSDTRGRYVFRNLAPGPYLVRAHLQGYAPARGRVMQVTSSGRASSNLMLVRGGDAADTPPVLAAGIGPVEPVAPVVGDQHDHDELSWRIRHGKRSVLKDAEAAVAEIGDEQSFLIRSRESLSRAMGQSARLASELFSDLSLNGEINLLTTTSFNRPQDLFAMNFGAPRGVAYVSLATPGTQGDWTMQGTVTQGDLASWILAGSYERRMPAAHVYEAGLSYAMQRYMGGNAEALAAMRDGSRNVGSVYAYDSWTLNPRLAISYGGEYASYDYLADRGLLSPRATISIRPSPDAPNLTLRATVLHREIAPGAEEFLTPTAGLWLPPERTFSHVSRDAFRPERVDHVEISAERRLPGDVLVGVRAFRQHIDDQIVTLFDAPGEGSTPSQVGHYQVGSVGEIDAHGWGVSVKRAVADGVRASFDYTQSDADWQGRSSESDVLAKLAASTRRTGERIHDMTASVESVVAPTATRLFVVYKLSSAFASSDALATAPSMGARFNVQVNQALPFLNFTSTHWEMLVAVSNLFHRELMDGSIYDELLVVRPPKRVLGGVTVRF
jgi:hypothetical protein